MNDVAPSFEELQAGLRRFWPSVTVRSIGDVERTVVVVHSVSMEVPDRILEIFHAYEERFLCLVLSLLRAPRSRVVYVTSQPILRRVVDYWFGLVPELDTPACRERLELVSVVDPRPRPLAEKLLAHPGVIERIRRGIADPKLAVIVPFTVSELELELALRLGIPIYGSHPALGAWGTKAGSRRAFAEAGVPHPCGVEDVGSVRDAVAAIASIQAQRPGVREVIVKLNSGVNGLGNGIVPLGGDGSLDEKLRRIELELSDGDPETFFADLERQGGIVEERIVGREFCSPSAQVRVSPDGEIEVLSTHDQVLGGPHGQTYVGCRFPAAPAYAPAIAREARRVAERLAREGAIGRFAVDFVAVRRGAGWDVYAVEINLRAGGTTHPYITLQTLTDGVYDEHGSAFATPEGRAKHYVATDHLESPGYARLTPDDFFDLVDEHRLCWDAEREVGPVFHLVSAIAVAGFVGVTAIGNSPEQAQAFYDRAKGALDEASACLG